MFYMFERLIEQHEAVTTDTASIYLSTEDIGSMKNAVTLLRPFEAATREMSGDQYLTISKLIPLARSLQQLTAGSSTVSPGLVMNCVCR